MARTPAWTKTTGRFLTPPIIIYGTLILLLFLLQSCLIYYPNVPSRTIIATPESIGLDYEPIKISTVDGLSLDA